MTREEKDAVVDGEAHDADGKELQVFHANLAFVAAEGPDTVEEIVACGGGSEADGVGPQVGQADHVAHQVEDAEVDHHAASTDDTEFEKLQDNHSHILFISLMHFRPIDVMFRPLSSQGRRMVPTQLHCANHRHISASAH